MAKTMQRVAFLLESGLLKVLLQSGCVRYCNRGLIALANEVLFEGLHVDCSSYSKKVGVPFPDNEKASIPQSLTGNPLLERFHALKLKPPFQHDEHGLPLLLSTRQCIQNGSCISSIREDAHSLPRKLMEPSLC